MKRIIKISIVLSTLLLTIVSCQPTNEPQEPPVKTLDELLIGQWEFTEANIFADGVKLTISSTEATFSMTLIFNEDKTFEFIEISEEEGTIYDSGTYIFNKTSSIIILTSDDSAIGQMEVSVLNEDELIIVDFEENAQLEMVFKRG